MVCVGAAGGVLVLHATEGGSSGSDGRVVGSKSGLEELSTASSFLGGSVKYLC